MNKSNTAVVAGI